MMKFGEKHIQVRIDGMGIVFYSHSGFGRAIQRMVRSPHAASAVSGQNIDCLSTQNKGFGGNSFVKIPDYHGETERSAGICEDSGRFRAEGRLHRK